MGAQVEITIFKQNIKARSHGDTHTREKKENSKKHVSSCEHRKKAILSVLSLQCSKQTFCDQQSNSEHIVTGSRPGSN